MLWETVSPLSPLRCVLVIVQQSLTVLSHTPHVSFPHASKKAQSIAGQHFFPYTTFLSGPSLFYMHILFVSSVMGQAPRNCQQVSYYEIMLFVPCFEMQTQSLFTAKLYHSD